jgi:hypothetical protein
MSAFVRLAGVLLVLAVGIDVLRTVLVPSGSGPLNLLAARALWRAARAVPGRMSSPARRAAGPTTLVVTVMVWFSGLLVGFALIYLPSVEDFSYASSAQFSGRGLPEALYLSGAALTTVGFGDVVAGSPVLRLITVVEAASGFAALTATLGYLPVIYGLVSDLRSSSIAVSDLGASEPAGAAELLAMDASSVLDAVRRDVIDTRQHLARFPVLHVFHAPYDESVVALARGATALWVAAHFADDKGRPLRRQVQALEQALRRLCEELARHTDGQGASSPADARAVFEQARAQALHRDPATAAQVTDEEVELLARLTGILTAYADWHADAPGSVPSAGT